MFPGLHLCYNIGGEFFGVITFLEWLLFMACWHSIFLRYAPNYFKLSVRFLFWFSAFLKLISILNSSDLLRSKVTLNACVFSSYAKNMWKNFAVYKFPKNNRGGENFRSSLNNNSKAVK